MEAVEAVEDVDPVEVVDAANEILVVHMCGHRDPGIRPFHPREEEAPYPYLILFRYPPFPLRRPPHVPACACLGA